MYCPCVASISADTATTKRSGRTGHLALILGPLGVLLGHDVAYRLLIPSSIDRADVLAKTGHSFLHTALMVAVTTVGALGVMVVCRSRPGRSSESRNGSLWKLFTSLALMQSSTYIVLELMERVMSGAGTRDLTPRVLLVGLIIQALVALVLALITRGLTALVSRVADEAFLGVDLPSTPLPWRSPAPASQAFLARAPARGPPLLRVS